DVASMGATPRWFLLTLLLPEQGTTPALLESIFAQMAEACAEVGAALRAALDEELDDDGQPICEAGCYKCLLSLLQNSPCRADFFAAGGESGGRGRPLLA
ncbi:MAG TPA: AIR synthase related protein, partial [Anaerolineae bacterium]|nr:AIR synthase related protein [Anaerolineae bacterium]